jgi:hypothetical protein
MDAEHQEPPRPPLQPGLDGEEAASVTPRLYSHTMLRTLFVATTVAATVAWIWAWEPLGGFVRLFITPVAVCFVAGLFGVSLMAGFVFGFIVATGADALRIATLPKDDMAFVTAIRFALEDALIGMWIVGLSWLTATLWGLYLRYAWSNPKWPPAVDDNDYLSSVECRWNIRERLMVRCAEAPVGFLLMSILTNVLIVIFGLAIAL